jgi:hypothetical protein
MPLDGVLGNVVFEDESVPLDLLGKRIDLGLDGLALLAHGVLLPSRSRARSLSG